jgi:hypothetical protein
MKKKPKYFPKGFVAGLVFSAVLIIPTFLVSYFRENVEPFKNMVWIALALFLPLGQFVSYLTYWRYEIQAPKEAKSNLTKEPFSSFANLGFEINVDCVEGFYAGYHCRIKWSPSGLFNTNWQSINLMVAFALDGKNLDEIIQRNKKRKWIWFDDGVVASEEYIFRKPKFEKVKLKLDQITNELQRQHLSPIEMKKN